VALIVTIPELAGLSHTFEVLRVDHQPEALVTSHPVEVGAEVTDHIQVLPVAFTVEAIVTDSPLVIASPLAVEQAILFLEQLQGKLCTVTIEGEGTWQSMALTRWPHSRTAMLGRSFSLGFRQIRIALGLSVTIPPRLPAPVARVGGPSEANLSTQAPSPGVPTSTLFQGSEVAGDLATQAAGSFGALFGF
jgi:hypothetical protein